MNKSAAKRLYRTAGLATPDWELLDPASPPARLAEQLSPLGLPCVLKPVDGGSSLDVVIAPDAAQRDRAVRELLGKYPTLLAERFIQGRELTVGILGERALPVIEIRPKRAFYDYVAKYTDDSTEYLFDTGLDAAVLASMQRAALKAHRALGCRDMSRTDFLLDAGNVPWVLETNTIPGFTSHSLLPKAAAKAGIPFGQLCEDLVNMALARR